MEPKISAKILKMVLLHQLKAVNLLINIYITNFFDAFKYRML